MKLFLLQEIIFLLFFFKRYLFFLVRLKLQKIVRTGRDFTNMRIWLKKCVYVLREKERGREGRRGRKRGLERGRRERGMHHERADKSKTHFNCWKLTLGPNTWGKKTQKTRNIETKFSFLHFCNIWFLPRHSQLWDRIRINFAENNESISISNWERENTPQSMAIL